MIRAVSALAGLRLIGVALSVVNSLWMARQLGLEELGLYSAALAVANLIGICVWLGFPTIATARVATSDMSWGVLRAVVVHLALVGTAVGLLLLNSSSADSSAIPSAASSLAAYPAARGVLMVCQGLLLGRSGTKTSTVVGDVAPQALVLLQLYLCRVNTGRDAAEITSLAFTASALLALICVLLARVKTSSGKDYSLVRLYLEAVSLTGSSWLRTLQESLPLLALAWFAPDGASKAGAFRLAQRGVGIAQLPLTACVAWLSPQIPKLIDRPRELGLLLQRASRLSLASSVGAFLVGAWLAEPLVIQVLGTDFTPSIRPLQILLAAGAYRHVSSYSLLTMGLTDNAVTALRIQALTLGLTAPLILVLSAALGAIGAALSVSISWAIAGWFGSRACGRILRVP